VNDWQKNHRTDFAHLDETTYAIAQAVAWGEEEITLDVPEDIQATADGYQDGPWPFIGLWLRSLQEMLPFIRLKVSGDGAAEAEAAAAQLAEEPETEGQQLKDTARRLRGQPVNGEMLLAALRAFREHAWARYGKQDLDAAVVALHEGRADYLHAPEVNQRDHLGPRQHPQIADVVALLQHHLDPVLGKATDNCTERSSAIFGPSHRSHGKASVGGSTCRRICNTTRPPQPGPTRTVMDVALTAAVLPPAWAETNWCSA
jgi:hypothetical protein